MFFSVLRSLWVQGGERGYATCGNILCIPYGYPVYPPKDILHTPWRYPVYPLGICCIPPWDTLCTLQNPAKAFKHYVKSLDTFVLSQGRTPSLSRLLMTSSTLSASTSPRLRATAKSPSCAIFFPTDGSSSNLSVIKTCL